MTGFLAYFILVVKNYCRENNLAFKALLILNDAPGPRDNFNDIDQNVKLF
jgi:hypothetical protein